MTFLNYALPPPEYTVKNALLWGNFCGHAEKACYGTWGKRIVHVLICVVEFLPIVSQIASIFEMIIVQQCLIRFRERTRIQETRQAGLEAVQQVVEIFNEGDNKENHSPKDSSPIQQPGQPEGEPDPPTPPIQLPNITPEQLQEKSSKDISPTSSQLSDTPSTDSETPVSIETTAELQLLNSNKGVNKDLCIVV